MSKIKDENWIINNLEKLQMTSLWKEKEISLEQEYCKDGQMYIVEQ